MPMNYLELFKKPQWRGDLKQKDDRREYLRNYLPSGRDGFVAEDLDLVVRYYSSSDPIGRIRLIETKCAAGRFEYSKRKTFGLLDDMCSLSVDSSRYDGFFVIYSAEIDWEKNHEICVNGFALNQEEFRAWFKCQLQVPRMDPMDIPENLASWKRQLVHQGNLLAI